MSLEKAELKNIVEGALLVADRTLGVDQLQALFDLDQRPERNDIKAVLEELQADYQERSAELVKVSSGYRLQVRQDYAPWIGRLWEEKPPRYSRALLETLSLIAYKQPITRGEIESIRGVAVSSNIIKTLIERDWIKVVGHKDVPGRPAMYATTKVFLDYFGLKGLDNLPPLAEIRDLDKVNQELPLEVVQDMGEQLGGAEKSSSGNDEDGDDIERADNVVKIALVQGGQNKTEQRTEREEKLAEIASLEEGDVSGADNDHEEYRQDTQNQETADEVGIADASLNTETDTQQN